MCEAEKIPEKSPEDFIREWLKVREDIAAQARSDKERPDEYRARIADETSIADQVFADSAYENLAKWKGPAPRAPVTEEERTAGIVAAYRSSGEQRKLRPEIQALEDAKRAPGNYPNGFLEKLKQKSFTFSELSDMLAETFPGDKITPQFVQYVADQNTVCIIPNPVADFSGAIKALARAGDHLVNKPEKKSKKPLSGNYATFFVLNDDPHRGKRHIATFTSDYSTAVPSSVALLCKAKNTGGRRVLDPLGNVCDMCVFTALERIDRLHLRGLWDADE